MDLVVSQIKFDKSEIVILGLMKLGNSLSVKFLAGIVTFTVYVIQLKMIENQKLPQSS